MRTVNAVARAVDILEYVARAPVPPRIGAIAADLAIPRNTAYDLVGTLTERQCLRVGPDGRIGLGVRLFELGTRYSQSIDLVAESRQVASALRDRCGETVHVAVLDDRFVIYLVKEESRQAVRMASAIGTRLPAHVTGVGKAMLAALPVPELRRRLAAVTLERMTSNSITDVSVLLADLEAARARGYATDNEESSPEVACVAAAVRNDENVVAGISISAPASRMTGTRRGDLAELVKGAAADLSTRLGYLPAVGAGWRKEGTPNS